MSEDQTNDTPLAQRLAQVAAQLDRLIPLAMAADEGSDAHALVAERNARAGLNAALERMTAANSKMSDKVRKLQAERDSALQIAQRATDRAAEHKRGAIAYTLASATTEQLLEALGERITDDQ